MPQVDLMRTEFLAKELITSSVLSPRQTVAFTGYFQAGDVVDVLAFNSCGAIVGTLATGLTVTGVDPTVAVFFDSAIDTSTALPAGGLGWYVVVRQIDDGQEAIDRLYRRLLAVVGGDLLLSKPVDSGAINTPVAGQTTLYLQDINLFAVGDVLTIISDSGVAGSGAILSMSPNADDTHNMATIVLNSALNLSGLTNIVAQTQVTVAAAVARLEARIDEIDKPIENEDLSGINGCMTVFEMANLFLHRTSKVYLDGVRSHLGSAGTRASLVNGASNAQLTFTSMVLNTAGNRIKIALLDPAAPSISLSLAVTGNFNAGYTISVTLATDGTSTITSTAKDVAALINGDSIAKRLVQAIYGGTGLGVQSALAATSLAGGLDDATYDYAELEQVYNNFSSATGYKFIAFNIMPGARNRMKMPPQDSEELYCDYRMALVNK